MKLNAGFVTAVVAALLCFDWEPASASESGNVGWPTFGTTLANTRHVDFQQISADSVRSLAVAWKFRAGVYGPFETTPIVVGRTMYITTGANHAVVALDATNGAQLWRYEATVGPVRICCGLVNRGVAMDAGQVFFATLDDKLIALDARTGVKRWETQVADPAQGYSETMAPLAWHGMVFIGSSGGEVGIRGSFSAYSQINGKLIWRWWSVSRGWEGHYVSAIAGKSPHRNIAQERRDAKKYPEAWQHGGGPVWMTPALDAARSTIYVSVGNPPDHPDMPHPGDNLYTCSLVALDARTGKMKWYYQEVPHDLWDYDAASPAVLFQTKDAAQRTIDAVGEAGKTGWFYVLNRDTGRLVRISDPVVRQRDIFKPPTQSGVTVTPSGFAGPVAPVAYDPASKLVFVQAKQGTFFKRTSDEWWSPVGTTYETLSAVNVDTGKISWHTIIGDGRGVNRSGGPLSAADLVFIGQQSGGNFQARSAKTGELLWSYQTGPGDETETDAPHRTLFQYLRDVLAGIKHWILREPQARSGSSQIYASPVAYAVDGREYVAIAAGAGYRVGRSPGDSLYVFALPKE
ncbi:MAG TPA: PQQ-binding-like beta-propeller repeat protein [Candidatus Eremiobacteraceae bacterium]|nr:PQQ-binding-like beta-propeller repeat protein [Candidatus Eremiobacteraceae bacterium]